MLASSHKPPGVDARCEMSMKGRSLENPKRGVEASGQVQENFGSDSQA